MITPGLKEVSANEVGFRGMAIDASVEIKVTTDLQTELVTEQNFEDFLEVNVAGWALGEFVQQTRHKLQRMAT